MPEEDRPSLLYVTHDARDAEAARAALHAGGWDVTAAISAAHALRLLERHAPRAFEVVAMDPRTPGAVELAAALASDPASRGVGFYLDIDAEAATSSRASRDRGVVGCGGLAKLASLSPRAARREAVVSFTTVMRVAWFARATLALRVGVEDAESAAKQVVLWLARGEPVDAAFEGSRGVDAVARLVPGSVLSGPVANVVTTSVVAEYETKPTGATIRCSMPTLLDLLDDDAPVLEVVEEELPESLWDTGWSMRPPDDPAAHGLAIAAADLDGVLEVAVIDASGAVVASVGGSSAGPAEAVLLWSALAIAVGAACPEEGIEEVVVASGETFDMLLPLYEEARVIHVRFARRHTNYALAAAELRRLCEDRRTQRPPSMRHGEHERAEASAS